MMALSLEAFVEVFGEARYKKIRKRRFIAYTDKHVISFNLDRDGGVMFGKVLPSQKDGMYEVKVSPNLLESLLSIKECLCECANGKALCHHMIAFCYHAMKEVSSTDLECTWSKPKVNPASDVKTIDELYPSPTHTALKQPVSADDVSNLVERMKEVSPYCGLVWLSEPEPPPEVVLSTVVLFQDLVSSERFLNCVNPADFLMKELQVTKSQVEEVERLTREQSSEGYWFRVREGRLTGSLIGSILWQMKTKRFPPSFYKSIFGMYNAGGSLTIQHDKSNEKEAVLEYEKLYNCKVEKCGLVLAEEGIIGSSPDRLVGQEIVCEFKCPSSMARVGGISIAIKELKSTYVKEDEQGNLLFNFEAPLDEHRKQAFNYYHQCQSHMYVTGRKMCHLGLWTKQEFRKMDVPWDPDWLKNVDILKHFYRTKYVPQYFDPKGVRFLERN